MSTSREHVSEEKEQYSEGLDNEAAKIFLRNATTLLATTVAIAAWSAPFYIISNRAAAAKKLNLPDISVFSYAFWAKYFPDSFKSSVNASAAKSAVTTGGKKINNHVDEAFAQSEEPTQNQQLLMKYKLMSLGFSSAAIAFIDVLSTGLFTNPATLYSQDKLIKKEPKDYLSPKMLLKLNRGALEPRYARTLVNSVMLYGFPLVNEEVDRFIKPGQYPLQNQLISGSLCAFVSGFITNPMSYLIKNVVAQTKFTRDADGKIIDLKVASSIDVFTRELKTHGIGAFFQLKHIIRVVPQQAGVIILFNMIGQKDLVPKAVYQWIDKQLPAKKIYTASQHQTLFRAQNQQKVEEMPVAAAPAPSNGIK